MARALPSSGIVEKHDLASDFGQIPWAPLFRRIERHSGRLALLLCLFFAIGSFAVAARRPLWCDEIITVSYARAATLKDLFRAFQSPYDQSTPLYTLVVRGFGRLFGWSDAVPRLPSIAFATAGVWILFCRVRSITDGLTGVTVAATLLITYLGDYAYEARPYAVLFCASALAVYAWTAPVSRISGRASLRSALLFGGAVALAICSHYYAVLLILPFFADELRSRGLRGLLTRRLVYGFTGMALALLLHLPLLEVASKRRLYAFVGAPSIHGLETSYPDMLAASFFVALGLIFIAVWTSSPRDLVSGLGSEERAGWFFLFIPVAGFGVAELVTHAFWARYFIPVLAGLSLAFGCFLHRRYGGRPQIALTLFVTATLLFFGRTFAHVRYARTPAISLRIETADFVDQFLPQLLREGKRIVLMPPDRSYLEARQYAGNDQALRVIRPSYLPAVKFEEDPLRMRFITLTELRDHARDTALISPSPELLMDLQKQNVHLHWRLAKPVAVVYLD